MKSVTSGIPFAHMQAFLDQTRGQITIGEIPPVRRAVLAAEGKRVRVALGKVMADDSVIDEVLPEIKRQRSR
jgi:hypothetical protein